MENVSFAEYLRIKRRHKKISL